MVACRAFCRTAVVVGVAAFALVAFSSSSRAQSWAPLKHQPKASASTMLLLTDGRVLMNDGGGTHWWLLTPDESGSYVHGTWVRAADANYDRLYFASAVLADGRVIVSGGEYSSLGGSETSATEIYDPVQDTWTAISAPTGWSNVGDAPSCVLADGRWLLGSIFNSDTALFDPTTNSWSAGPNMQNTSGTEESWALMADGTVLKCDCYNHPNAERYDPSSNTWVSCGTTPVDLVEASSLEIGPAILMNDGRMFCMGATPHCALFTSPTTSSGAGTWVQGSDPPKAGPYTLGTKDGPACLLPNGNVLAALAPVDGVAGHFLGPTVFFETDGTTWTREPAPANHYGAPFTGRLLLVPTGEALFAANSIYVYTCAGGPNAAWAPTVTSVSDQLVTGQSYPLAGTQLNGLSQAVGYGDDAQAATNYPLVRLTNVASGHVVYCRTHDHSTMAVATGSAIVSTNFDVPTGVEYGAAKLEVVANGIASAPVSVFVRAPVAIGFDDLPAGWNVTSDYLGASFSSDPGFATWTTTSYGASSSPNALATGPAGGGVDGLHNSYVDFPVPVDSLTFDAIGVDLAGPAATVNVFENGVHTGTLSLDGAGTPSIPVRVDLTAFHDVTRVEVVNVLDPGGLALDDFVFGIDATASRASYGSGFAGTHGVPTLTTQDEPRIASTVTLDLTNSLGASTFAVVLVGVQQTSTPMPSGATLLVQPLFTIALTLPAAGAALDADVPDDGSLAGVHVFLQGLELDAGAKGGVSYTAGVDLELGY
jgi:hypothetical protein